jgi:hypothetical protein
MKIRSFHFLQNVPLILLSLVILSLSLLSYNFGFASLFLAVFTVIRIVVTKERPLIFLAVICALFIGFLIGRESFHFIKYLLLGNLINS